MNDVNLTLNFVTLSEPGWRNFVLIKLWCGIIMNTGIMKILSNIMVMLFVVLWCIVLFYFNNAGLTNILLPVAGLIVLRRITNKTMISTLK